MSKNTKWLVLLLVGCVPYDPIKVPNVAPVPTLTSPLGGESFTEGDWISGHGHATDGDEFNSAKTPNEDLIVTWMIGDQEQCNLSPQSDGYFWCDFQVPVGQGSELIITLTAVDADGAIGTDTATLTVNPNNAPSCTMTAPTADGSYSADVPLSFEATCLDVETLGEDLQLWWTTTPTGGAETDVAVSNVSRINNEDGASTTDSGVLLEGYQTVCIHAEDEAGQETTDCEVIYVQPANLVPTCEIILPVDGNTGSVGGMVYFEGVVSDPDGDTNTLNVTWNSDLSGSWSSIPYNGQVSSFSLNLAEGVHTISLVAEDDRGGSCVDQIRFTMGDGPDVAILAPTSGELVDVEQTIYFEAEYDDLLTSCSQMSDLRWYTYAGDVLWEQSSGDSSCISAFTTTLAEGSHIIYFEATDGDGLSNSDVIYLEVGSCLSTWYEDLDGDNYGNAEVTAEACSAPPGYVDIVGDCDDSASNINPGEAESCNGLDDNCDGTLDEGYTLSTWYLDHDGDGYGPNTPDPEDLLEACAGPTESWVDVDGDCNDLDASVYPGASEACNNEDDDCDGSIDEDFAYPASTVWYADEDGDGYGDAAYATTDCEQPADYVTDDTDCDDTTTAVNPGHAEICDGEDNDCDGSQDNFGALGCSYQFYDADGDGYGDDTTACVCEDYAELYTAAMSGDCDNSDATIHPDAAESCDSIDNDCDTVIDPQDSIGCSEYFYDGDNDGQYASGAPTQCLCAATEPYDVLTGGDCNDSNAASYTGATEICDYDDNDCDGATDEGLLNTYYQDIDSDGYGNLSVSTEACDAPSGYVSSPNDCDDATATTYPGATETCDGADNDCDGSIDDGLYATWYADADGDGYGDSAASTYTCSPPSGYVSNATDCNDGSASISPADAEVCDAVDNDCDGVADDGVTYTTYYRDNDGDGYGNASSTTSSCSGAPSGYVSNATDCNDGTSSISPADAEVCDGVDNDCDGVADEGSVCVYADTETFTPAGTGSVCPQGVSGWTGGDCEFDGHGPNVTITASLSYTSSYVTMAFHFDATETASDWTSTSYDYTTTVYTAPSNCTITGLSSTSGSCSYTDTNHGVDYPASSGMINTCEVVGDTSGDDACNCNGDNDVNFSVTFDTVTVYLSCVETP